MGLDSTHSSPPLSRAHTSSFPPPRLRALLRAHTSLFPPPRLRALLKLVCFNRSPPIIIKARISFLGQALTRPVLSVTTDEKARICRSLSLESSKYACGQLVDGPAAVRGEVAERQRELIGL